MIDGTQLLTMFAICFYMGLGCIIGFVAAMFLIPAYCVAHPIVLAWWERYRMAVDVRKNVQAATLILVEKLHEADLAATKEMFKELAREKMGPPEPPSNELFKKGG